MLSNIILRSTAAFGGAPFRLKKCTALTSAATGAAGGSVAGGVPGALVGGALGVASSLLGGLFGKHNTNKINQMNYRIMQEQNRFNAEEAKKNRDWQELISSSSVKEPKVSSNWERKLDVSIIGCKDSLISRKV